MSISGLQRALLGLFFLIASHVMPLSVANAQVAIPTAPSDPPPIVIDETLTDEEFQALLGTLTDAQVRDILIAQFAELRPAPALQGEGLLNQAREFGKSLKANAQVIFSKWSDMGEAFSVFGRALEDTGGFWNGVLTLVICVSVGLIVRFFWRRKAAQRQLKLAERNQGKGPYADFGIISDAGLFLIIDLSSALAFALSAHAVLYAFFDHPNLHIFVSSYIAVLTIYMVVRSFLDLMFPLNWPVYRIVAINDQAARSVHAVILWLGVFWMFEETTSGLMVRFGAPEGTDVLFSLIGSVVWVISAFAGLSLIHRTTADLLPGPDQNGIAAGLTRNWAALMTLFVIANWMLFAGGGLVSGNADFVAASVLKLTLLLFGFWFLYRVVVLNLRSKAISEEMAGAIARMVRAALIALGMVLNLFIWGIDPDSVAASGLAGKIIETSIDVFLTLIIGWAIWDFVRTMIDARIAEEMPDQEDDEPAEGEGGLGASRTATLLPLLRSSAMAAIGITSVLTAAASLGVNIAPLIAGAGVVGLAIGFGAQTLVKDIVSGVFFLIDDAFRRGEYIDLGTVKGTVERISVRSLQLRHHLGAVHTIPFGDITALTNYSRDWVIMKLPLRLTFDTDPQKVKKLIKQIGAEFMENEEIGKGLLEPPKSQGVIQMEDSAMILRVKFKAIPGKQFVIRRELLHKIRAVFEQEGIRFANREVTVRVNEGATEAEKMEAAGAAAARGVEAPQPAP